MIIITKPTITITITTNNTKKKRYEKFVPTFIPIASVPLNGFIAVLAGRLPEFLDSRFVVKNEGREGKFLDII